MKAPSDVRTILLLGAGELGRELALAARAFGLRVVAVDRYPGAPAMQVADHTEVISMLDPDALEDLMARVRPDVVIPEVEAIRTEKLVELEARGLCVVPTARAVQLTMDREGIRELAHLKLGLPTPRYVFADSEEALRSACDEVGYPCVVKPTMSSSGKGQSVVTGPARVSVAWEFAQEGGRGDSGRVIAEEFIEFEEEITQLVVREWDGTTHFVRPIGHRQERGDYQESWMPTSLPGPRLDEVREMSRAVAAALGGAGILGVEFFITPDRILFSEVSPRPHDTGLVTLVSQNLSQFQLHLRAVLGFPIPELSYPCPAASAVILADREAPVLGYRGLNRALQVEGSDLRIFGKPTGHRFRRMGVALALGETVEEARRRALEVAARVEIVYGPGEG